MSSPPSSPKSAALSPQSANTQAKAFVELHGNSKEVSERSRPSPSAASQDRARPDIGPPKEAFARFKQFLNSGNSVMKRNYEMNVERVDEFIQKPARQWKITKPKEEAQTYKHVAGIGTTEVKGNMPSSNRLIDSANLNTSHDMDTALFTRARMGDGSGSKWDQWILATAQPLAAEADFHYFFDNEGTPLADRQPLSGFKRHQAATRKAMTHTIQYPAAGSSVKTYAERRQERLQKEKEALGTRLTTSKESDMSTDVDNDALSSFLLTQAETKMISSPSPSEPKDAMKPTENPPPSSSSLSSSSSSLNLPHNPKYDDVLDILAKEMTPEQADIYFGSSGRRLFFEAYKSLESGRDKFYVPARDKQARGVDLRRLIPPGSKEQYQHERELELSVLRREIEYRLEAEAAATAAAADNDAGTGAGAEDSIRDQKALHTSHDDKETQQAADEEAAAAAAAQEALEIAQEIDEAMAAVVSGGEAQETPSTAQPMGSDTEPSTVGIEEECGELHTDRSEVDAQGALDKMESSAPSLRLTPEEEENLRRMRERSIAHTEEQSELERHLNFLPMKPYSEANDPWVGSEGYKRGRRSRVPRSPAESPRADHRKSAEELAQEAHHQARGEEGVVFLRNGEEQPSVGALPLASPRSRFIAACVTEGLPPLPEVMIRRTVDPVLDLSHRKLGDVVARQLAEALHGMPYLEELDLTDNRLTDASLPNIIEALPHCKHFRRINLSNNKIDAKASDALNTLLSSSGRIDTVILRRADVDDEETAKWVKAIASQKTVKTLDLTENLIGSHEVRAFQPLPQTGGVALGDLLRQPDCGLERLELAWNMIRFKSGEVLAQSLACNKSLTYLDLSFNSLDEAGGEVIGSSLLANGTLRHLALENNNISARATVAIVTGLRAWTNRLETLNLKHNPIGERGCRAVMALKLGLGAAGALVDIGDCAVRLASPTCWFDVRAPGGTYDLNLSSPYNRAVAMELFRLAAEHEQYTVKNAVLIDTNGRESKLELTTHSKPVSEVKPALANQIATKSKSVRPDAMSDEKLQRIRSIASDPEKADLVFKQFDVDDSGALDKHELRQMLRQLGIGDSMVMVRKLLEIYDADGSGLVEREEFAAFLQGIHDGELKARQFEGQVRFIGNAQLHTKVPYIPPDSGRLKCQIAVSVVQPDFIEAISEERLDGLISLSKNSVDGDAILDFALSTIKLKHEEASKLFRIMVKQTADTTASLSKILPRMLNATEARILLNDASADEVRVRCALRARLGGLLQVILGQPNGSYSLSLADEFDKECLHRLVELSVKLAAERRLADLGDTSQLSDFSCFRNVTLDGKKFFLDCARYNAAALAPQGRLVFDFAYFPLRSSRMQSPSSSQKSSPSKSTNGDDDGDDDDEQDVKVGVTRAPTQAMSSQRLFNVMCALGMMESKKKMAMLNNITFLQKEIHGATTLQSERQWKWSEEFATQVALHVAELSRPDPPVLSKGTPRRNTLVPAGSPGSPDSTDPLDGDDGDEFATRARGDAVAEDGFIREETLFDFEGRVLHHMDIRHPLPLRRRRGPVKVDVEDDHALAAHAQDDSSSQGETVQTTVEGMAAYLSRLKAANDDRHEILIALDAQGREMIADKKLERLLSSLKDASMVSSRGNRSSAQLRAAADAGVVDENTAQLAQIKEDEEAARATGDDEALRKLAMVSKDLRLPKDVMMDELHDRRLVQFLGDLLCGRGLSCAQLAFMIMRIPGASVSTYRLGTRRVDFVVTLSSQVVDMQNFDIVLKKLDTAREVAMVLVRMGWLNVWSPLKPEGAYVLNLSSCEERLVAKTLLVLGVMEKGDTPSTRVPRLRDMVWSNVLSVAPSEAPSSMESGVKGGEETTSSASAPGSKKNKEKDSKASHDKNAGDVPGDTKELLLESSLGAKGWLQESSLPTTGWWHVKYHSVLSIKCEERDYELDLHPLPRLMLMPAFTARALSQSVYHQFTLHRATKRIKDVLATSIKASRSEASRGMISDGETKDGTTGKEDDTGAEAVPVIKTIPSTDAEDEEDERSKERLLIAAEEAEAAQNASAEKELYDSTLTIIRAPIQLNDATDEAAAPSSLTKAEAEEADSGAK